MERLILYLFQSENIHIKHSYQTNTVAADVLMCTSLDVCLIIWFFHLGADFVDRHREQLILKVTSVMEIADCLISKNMITTEAYDKIHGKSPSQEQMRLLYKSLDSGGAIVKAEFYRILRKKHAFMVYELEFG